MGRGLPARSGPVSRQFFFDLAELLLRLAVGGIDGEELFPGAQGQLILAGCGENRRHAGERAEMARLQHQHTVYVRHRLAIVAHLVMQRRPLVPAFDVIGRERDCLIVEIERHRLRRARRRVALGDFGDESANPEYVEMQRMVMATTGFPPASATCVELLVDGSHKYPRLLQDIAEGRNGMQVLTAPGLNRLTAETLVDVLELVRGAPLADAAPGQWRWAEELRTDMSSVARDAGVLLARWAVERRDLDLARWAAARALVAAPEDELLLVERIHTEHAAGNTGEVERLVRWVTSQARVLGVDLAPETVDTCQRVLEGRTRPRAVR